MQTARCVSGIRTAVGLVRGDVLALATTIPRPSLSTSTTREWGMTRLAERDDHEGMIIQSGGASEAISPPMGKVRESLGKFGRLATGEGNFSSES